MTKLSYSIIPTWAARLPRGVGIVGGGVVGATQPRQPQEDQGQTQDRGHVTRGQGRSLCPDISEASLSLSSSQQLTLVPDTRRSLTNWQLRLRASVRFRGCEVVGGSWLRGWSLARPRTLRDDDGRQQVSLIIPVMRTHRRHIFMTASSTSLGQWSLGRKPPVVLRDVNRIKTIPDMFEYKVISGPRRKHIWSVQRKQSDTIRHTLTVTRPNHSVSSNKLSYSDPQLKYSVGSLEITQTLLLQAKIEARGESKSQLELDKIWASSRLCG